MPRSARFRSTLILKPVAGETAGEILIVVSIPPGNGAAPFTKPAHVVGAVPVQVPVKSTAAASFTIGPSSSKAPARPPTTVANLFIDILFSVMGQSLLPTHVTLGVIPSLRTVPRLKIVTHFYFHFPDDAAVTVRLRIRHLVRKDERRAGATPNLARDLN